MGSSRILKKEYSNTKYLMMERKNVTNLSGCVLCCSHHTNYIRFKTASIEDALLFYVPTLKKKSAN